MSLSVKDKELAKFRGPDSDIKIAVTDESSGKSVAIDEVSASLTYIGKAITGSTQSSAVWQISKLETISGVTLLQFADGDDSYDNIWDDRATLTYS